MRRKSEKQLIRRLRERDESAFNKIVTSYQHKVYNLVYQIVRDRHEAEDVCQEVFVSVFRSIHRFRGDSQFSTWLYRIAVNHAKNRVKYLARRQRSKQQSLDDTREGDMAEPIGERIANPERTALGLELEEVLQNAIATLDEDQRTLIVLRDIQSLTYAEISEIAQIPEGTVKSRLHRARMQLTHIVKRHMDG